MCFIVISMMLNEDSDVKKTTFEYHGWILLSLAF